KVPDASKFRDKPLEFEHELRTLFDSVHSTGGINWNPARKGMPNDSRSLETENQETNLPDEESTQSAQQEPVPNSDCATSSGVSKKRKRFDSVDDDLVLIELKNLVGMIKDQIVLGPTPEQCLEALRELKEVHGLSVAAYNVGIKAFCQEKEYKTFFLALKTPQERILFLNSLI
ncbi:hypothetical protein FRX31_031282, partial [Thalictrum thalictroides]